MKRPVIIFEDDRFSGLYPLALTRPVSDLVCGAFSLAEKVRLGLARAAGLDPDIHFHVRAYLKPTVEYPVESYKQLLGGSGMITLINGRLLWRDDLLERIDPTRPGRYVSGGETVWASLPAAGSGSVEAIIGPLDDAIGSPLTEQVLGKIASDGLPTEEIEAALIAHPWDLIAMNGEEIGLDFVRLGGKAVQSEIEDFVHMMNPDAIRIGSNVRLSPGVVIDATAGPVSIGDDVRVQPNASLQGPLHLGSGSIVKMGAKIYGETTIGPVCKVGGEVGETIVHGCSNKQHEGFVGHSYLGEWVNIGAGTDTSDMKNNYSAVRVPIGGKPVDSGQLFVGLFMGDHSKSGIGTVFNTGSAVGVCCNVYGADYPPKYIPSFAWGGSSGFSEHDLERAIETARRAMQRRGRTLDSGGEGVLREVFDLTRSERQTFLSR